MSEASIQKTIRAYLVVNNIDSVHFANGAVLAGDKAARGKQIAKLKAAGMVNGAADLILFDRKQSRVGFMEVKQEGGRQSDSQKAFEALSRDVWGLPYAIVRSIADASETLTKWGWR